MSQREIPEDAAEALTAARRIEQARRERRDSALRDAVDALQRHGWTRAEAVAVVKDAGWTQNDIADALGVSHTRVGQLLNPEKERARDRARERVRVKPRSKEAVELRAAAEKLERQGLSHSEIATELGTSRQRVTQLLRLTQTTG
jgi:DNA-binding transcriptional regulator LsrR (DeoR family)